jgi:hypothetical protein
VRQKHMIVGKADATFGQVQSQWFAHCLEGFWANWASYKAPHALFPFSSFCFYAGILTRSTLAIFANQ